MKIKYISKICIFCTLLTLLLTCSSCIVIPEDNTRKDLAVQQTMIAIQQTQLALDNANAQQSQPEPEEQAPEIQPPVEQPDVVFEGISFSFDPAIAGNVSPEIIPGQNTGESPFPGDTYPTYFAFYFGSYPVQEYFHPPRIQVYPAEEYQAISPEAGNIIDELEQALISRPGGSSTGPSHMPFLPMWNAGQMFSAKVEYFNFQNGSGVRFLTMYGQDISPVNNFDLFYTYQGITHDGQYYISAILPIINWALPEDDYVEDYMAFTGNWETYLSNILTWMEEEPTSNFNPNIDLLDEMMASFKIDR